MLTSFGYSDHWVTCWPTDVLPTLKKISNISNIECKSVSLTLYIPGDPRKSDELVFWITSKVVKIEPSYWMEKKQNFI